MKTNKTTYSLIRRYRQAFPFLAVALAILISASLLGGCRKASDNGKLDAQWQIMKIENTADGTVSIPAESRYICFNLHVVNLFPGHYAGNLRYDKDESRITLDFPYDTDASGLAALAEFGIPSNPVTFDILKLDGKELVLRAPGSVITCRRF